MATMEAYQIHLHHKGDYTPDAIKDNLVLSRQPMPQPAPGQVLVQVKAVSLNYRDIYVLTGNPRYPVQTQEGVVPGAEGAGVVVESSNPQWKAGDRVLIIHNGSWKEGLTVAAIDFQKTLGAGNRNGTLTKYLALDADYLLPVPPHLSFEQGAALSSIFLTGWNALYGGPRKLQRGDWVLTQGTGVVSLAATTLAVAAGAKVVALSSTEDRLKLLKEEYGATTTINYNTYPEWSGKVREATDMNGVDLVVEVIGSSSIVESLRATRTGGHVSLIGFLSKPEPQEILFEIVKGAKTVRGVAFGSIPMYNDMLRFVQEHNIEPPIDRVFRWAATADAYRYLAERKAVGKIVIQVG